MLQADPTTRRDADHACGSDGDLSHAERDSNAGTQRDLAATGGEGVPTAGRAGQDGACEATVARTVLVGNGGDAVTRPMNRAASKLGSVARRQVADLSLSPGAIDLLRAAMSEADQRNHSAVTTGDILRAMLSDRDELQAFAAVRAMKARTLPVDRDFIVAYLEDQD